MKTDTHGKVHKSNGDCSFKFTDENFNESRLEDVRVEKQQEYDNNREQNTHILYPANKLNKG